MSAGDDDLIAARSLRDTARATMARDWATFREAASLAGITTRISGAASRRAGEAANQVRAAARANRGTLATVAGLAAAGLAGWIFRKPLAGLAEQAAQALMTALERNEDEA